MLWRKHNRLNRSLNKLSELFFQFSYKASVGRLLDQEINKASTSSEGLIGLSVTSEK